MSCSRGLRVLKALEIYRKKLPDQFDSSTILNKVHIDSMSRGCAKASFVVDMSMSNAGGTLHGGYIASVIDCLSFFTIFSDPNGLTSWTTSLNVEYMKAPKIGEKVLVETKIVKNDNTTTLETGLFDVSGAMLAKGTANFHPCGERLQKLVKQLLHFDVYEKY